MDPLPFRDRAQAGRHLAARLLGYAGRDDVLVLGLPRGGVPVAYEVASALNAPLDVFVVRKVGFPGHEELAMGAIAHDGVLVLNEVLLRTVAIPPHVVEAAARRESNEVRRQERAFRGSRVFPDLRERTVILVDDGLATGSTIRAAIGALKRLGAARVVAAVPVGSAESCREIEAVADEVVCATAPEPFLSVGEFYADFRQTTDDEVRMLVERAARERREGARPPGGPPTGR
jgi:predicted phosphoribosyltransferase